MPAQTQPSSKATDPTTSSNQAEGDYSRKDQNKTPPVETKESSPGTAPAEVETKSEPTAKSSDVETDKPQFDWIVDVFGPVTRFAGITLILGAFLWFLELPSVLKKEQWSERTIVAFAVVFTYCAVALMGARVCC